MAAKSASNLPYCAQVVKDHDPDRFLLSLLSPESGREALWALFAFNYEIAKTREVVSDTQLGLIRLQWWRDAITAIYERGSVPEHDIVQALAKAIDAHDLPQESFETLIYAREFDLEDTLPAHLEGTLNYADFTSAPLMRLALIACGDEPDLEPVQPVAVNYALVGLLRAVLFHASQRRCYLPQDLLEQAGIQAHDLYENRNLARLPDVIGAVASEFVGGIESDSRFLSLSQKLAEMYWLQLRRAGFDVFSSRLRVPPPFKALKLALLALFGRFEPKTIDTNADNMVL